MLLVRTAFLKVMSKIVKTLRQVFRSWIARSILVPCAAFAALFFPVLAPAQNLFAISGGSVGNVPILEITPSGNVTTFASGFNQPTGLAFNGNGDLFVANENGTISQVTPTGNVSTFATGFSGFLGGPSGLAFDGSGNLYVANTNNNVIYKVTPAGNVTAFASGFNVPFGLAFNSSGDLFVANSGKRHYR